MGIWQPDALTSRLNIILIRLDLIIVVWIIIVFLGPSPLAYLAGICGSALPATHQASPLNLYLGATQVNTGAILKNREQNNTTRNTDFDS